jgi:hypothetical protein
MTGFGWDPSHSIVKARQEGLQTVLYKPFRADRLMEAVEQALRSAPAPAAGHPDGNPAKGSAPMGPSTVAASPPIRGRSAGVPPSHATGRDPADDHPRPVENANHDT